MERRWDPPEPARPNLLTNDDSYLGEILMDDTINVLEQRKEYLRVLRDKIRAAKMDRDLFTKKLEEVEG